MRFLNKSSLSQWRSKICLLRIDLNIKPGEEKNAMRLDAALPTIRLFLKYNIKVVLLSHRGRPHSVDRKLSLKPFAPVLSKKLKRSVVFINNFNFGKIKKQIQSSRQQVFLLENLRFLAGEEKNDVKLARQLASLGDFYVNDAFAVSHRKNASVVAVTRFLPSYAGLLVEREITNLNRALTRYQHPFTVIIGGAKISDKLGVIKSFWNKADYFLLGGGPANTFFAAQDLPVGDSLVDKSQISNLPGLARARPRAGKSQKYLNSKKLILPLDVKIHNRQILDIGGRTVKKYSEIIRKSKTIIWNGPMGLFEKKGFEKGTLGIWKAILSNKRACIVIGGGETIASLRLLKANSYKLKANVFLSTGGGAMLEYLSGKKLSGVEALK